MLKLIECPRDAMQGLKNYIPAKTKADYINSLLQVGFDTIDFGSFVSPKAIPQLRDTAEVIKLLDMSDTKTKLLAIIGNIRGAENAVEFDEVTYLGFPFSISETFLKLNIKSTYKQAIANIDTIHNMAAAKNKHMVVYLSMAFGNPYGDICTEDSLFKGIEELIKIGIKTINLADTVGVGKAADIGSIYSRVKNAFPNIEIGLHLHTTPKTYLNKINEAYKNGCRMFDSVMLGLGGCPMSAKELIGNLSTENLLNYFSQNNISIPINIDKFRVAQKKAAKLFSV